MILWTDIESTDLDERNAFLLEVAMIATDDDLVERADATVVINPPVPIDDIKMSLIVREMHEKSGLIADIKAGKGYSLAHAEELLLTWLRSQFVRIEDLRAIPLAGSTIAFDRRWIRHHIPAVEMAFLHRSIDVSAINELASRWAPAIFQGRPMQPKGVPHRALADVRHSIKTLRYYRECGFVGGR